VHVSNRHFLSEIRFHQAELQRWQAYMGARAALRRPGCRAIKPRPRASEELGVMIWTLCERLAKHRYFRGYTYRHDLVAAGALACLEALPKFNTMRFSWDAVSQSLRHPNAFSYFTQCAWRAMRKMQVTEQRHSHASLPPTDRDSLTIS
jgi:hypothetical protein